MGLFDKKKPKGADEFDSPVEMVNLTAPEPPRPPPKPPAPEPPPEPKLSVGINWAIELMRKLPRDNVELVVSVVKTTLESMQVKVTTIIDDASRKQKDIDSRVGILKKEIGELESEISVRKKEIGTLEEDHRETSDVKDKLVLAEKRAVGVPPAQVAAAKK